MSAVPNTVPGEWNIIIQKGATWPGTTITMSRDGVQVIPVSAALTIHAPDGTLLVTLAATIDGAGEMTVPKISAVTTAAYTWTYGNLLFRTTESASVVTDLLAGNATVVSRGD